MESRSTVSHNVEVLIGLNQAIADSLKKAERNSHIENVYFLEKLHETARCLGHKLEKVKK